MKAALIQILMGAIGTLGFSIYFRVSERNVAAATFGGALGWGVYLLCFHLWGNVFAANVVATAVVYFWSVAMARVLKAPSNSLAARRPAVLHHGRAGGRRSRPVHQERYHHHFGHIRYGHRHGSSRRGVLLYSQAAAEMQP